MNLAAKLYDIHMNPILRLTDPLDIRECTPGTVRRLVEQDESSWFIRHGGKYLLYCDKRTSSPFELDSLVKETWARYMEYPISQIEDYIGLGNSSASEYLC